MRSVSRHRSDIRETRQPVPTSDVLQGRRRCGAGNRSGVLCAGYADVRVHQERAQGPRGEGRECIGVRAVAPSIQLLSSRPLARPARRPYTTKRFLCALADTYASAASKRASSNTSAAQEEKQERSLDKDTPLPARPSRQRRRPPKPTTSDGSSSAH